MLKFSNIHTCFMASLYCLTLAALSAFFSACCCSLVLTFTRPCILKVRKMTPSLGLKSPAYLIFIYESIDDLFRLLTTQLTQYCVTSYSFVIRQSEPISGFHVSIRIFRNFAIRRKTEADSRPLT